MRWRWGGRALCQSKLLDVDPAELSCAVVPGSPERRGSILRSAHPAPVSNAIQSPQNSRCSESDYLSIGQAVLRRNESQHSSAILAGRVALTPPATPLNGSRILTPDGSRRKIDPPGCVELSQGLDRVEGGGCDSQCA